MDVFAVSKQFVLSCYTTTKSFPSEEKFAMVQQIRRAALSVHLTVAEGCTRRSLQERKPFYEIARGSVIEIDTALDIAANLGYISQESLAELGVLLIRSFQLISKLIS
ncbi:MAG TPA: four helix bundle protein [Chitinophagaceae bacterium]|nr:four helix bundle protein [Chitinophagaceae bacterium]